MNFKCFTDAKIPVKKLTVLCGGNSAGKSTVIQAILLLRSAINQLKNGASKVMLNGDYLLGLGNSFNVIPSKSPSNVIFIELFYSERRYPFGTADRLGRGDRYVNLYADSKEAKTFLDIKSSNGFSTLLRDDPQNQYGHPIQAHNFHYLNAERLGPRPFYAVSEQGRNVGSQGEYAISLLSSSAADTQDYDVSASKMYPGSRNPRLRAQVEAWMGEIVPGLSINAQKISEINQAYVKYGNATPQNVGFGISYVLPVVLSGLLASENEMFIVENPEAHLHPSGQSRIGKFLARVAASGVHVIVETHSEHVINGIRIASLDGTIDNSGIVVNFFSREEDNQSVVTSIDINNAGDLTSYPKGFFDQQQRDFAEIVKQKRNQLH